MFRLQDKKTGLWFKFMDRDIIWTGNKAQAFIFGSDKREFWLEYEDEMEIIEVGEDEVMGLMGTERLPGF